MKFFESFSEKHPKAAQWIREGGLFLIFSYVITFLKYLMLLFLPKLFSAYADNGWGWPGIEGSLFGISFTFNVIGYAVADGGMAYMFANLVSSLLGECVNFPLQRNITFRSKGPLSTYSVKASDTALLYGMARYFLSCKCHKQCVGRRGKGIASRSGL